MQTHKNQHCAKADGQCGMSSSCQPKAAKVPSEIWHEILSFCGIEDALRLERVSSTPNNFVAALTHRLSDMPVLLLSRLKSALLVETSATT